MKYIISYLIIFGSLNSCNNKIENINTFSTVLLGGENRHGYLYNKKYPNPNDSNINYKKWAGYEVNSNTEIELLLKIDPNCEALRFNSWNLDSINYIELTNKIGDFKHLKFLKIHTNRLRTFPKAIEKLTNLEEIHFNQAQNELIKIDFSKFKKLKHLTIQFADNTKYFPFTIFDCQNLESLKLFRFFSNKNNVLQGVEKLTNLKELFIFDSNLTLPQDVLYNYQNLETLIIDRIRTPLPEYFYNSLSIRRIALISMFDTLNLTKLSMMKNLECVSISYHNALSGKT